MIQTNVNIRVKLSGSRDKLADVIALLETEYIIVPTSDFLPNDKERLGVHVYLTLIPRREVVQA